MGHLQIAAVRENNRGLGLKPENFSQAHGTLPGEVAKARQECLATWRPRRISTSCGLASC